MCREKRAARVGGRVIRFFFFPDLFYFLQKASIVEKGLFVV